MNKIKSQRKTKYFKIPTFPYKRFSLFDKQNERYYNLIKLNKDFRLIAAISNSDYLTPTQVREILNNHPELMSYRLWKAEIDDP